MKLAGLCSLLRPLAVILLLATVSTQAQNSKIDSLHSELSAHIQRDTLRVNILNELALSYLGIDLEESTKYLDEAEDVLDTIQFQKGQAKTLYIKGSIQSSKSNNEQAIGLFRKALLLFEEGGFERSVSDCYAKIGLAYYNNFDYQKSIENYKKSIAIAERMDLSHTSATSLKYIGFCYLDMGDYESALEYLTYAIDLNNANKDTLEISSCLNNIGTTYLHRGNYPLALEYYNKSLSNYKILKDTSGISSVLNNIGIVFKNNKQYDKAIANYKESLKIQEERDNKKNQALTLNNIGVVYKQKEEYDSALLFITDALSLSISINDKDNIARCLINLGDVYLGFNDNDTALEKFSQARKINTEIGSQLGLCYSYLGLAKVYVNQKNFKKGLINASKSLELSKTIGIIDYRRDAYGLLSIIYKELGRFNEALISHQQFKVLNDSLFNKENIEKIAQLEYEYKYQQELDSAHIRELQLTKTVLTTSQDLAKSRQNYLWAVIGILVVSILLGSVVFYQKFNTIKIQNQNIVTEQKLLRSQMTPHFIFNSLSVLQGMILNKEEQKSVSYLSKFSRLLRIVLENSRDKLVPLNQELDAIDNYMTLQNMDDTPPYDYSLKVDDTIDTNQFLIPPMLIQPFIENAIEHAFQAEQANREIKVHLSLETKKLRCTITDNGIGIDTISTIATSKKKSLATTITTERLNLLAKDFDVEGAVVIEDRKKYQEQGTIVKLQIPFKTTEHS